MSMKFSIPLMVSITKREAYEIFLPGITKKSFRGVSLAELLDDAALHLMEEIPKTPMAQMPKFQFCPHVQLRKVKVTLSLMPPGWKIALRLEPKKRKPKPEEWTGRFAVVLKKWPKEPYYTVTVPRLGTDCFAIQRTGDLEAGLKRFLEEWAERHRLESTAFNALVCAASEYLDILEVEAEMPSVLPSRPKRRKKKKRKQKKKKNKGQAKPKSKSKPRRYLVPPTTLRSVGMNLTHRAIDGRLSPTFGRDGLVEQIMHLVQREGAAILLVGPSGVGKSAIVHEVVRRLASGSTSLQERTDTWEVDGNRIIAGMSVVGAWEKRCRDMIHELEQRCDLLYVDDLPALVYTGRSAHSDTHVAGYLEPHIARGDIRIIGECTPERLEAVREEAPGFFSRFRVIQIPELSEEDTLMVLVHAMRRLEGDESAVLQPDLLEAVLALTRRFMTHRCNPGKAIRLLRQVTGDYQDVRYDDFGRRIVGRDELIRFFARQTGLPGFILWEQDTIPYERIRAYFERRIVAQEAAIDAVTDVVAVLQQGLNDPERPLANLLFVGPTGVGKTETAKALAAYLFGHAERLVRFDMSEFMDPYSVTRLIGDRFQPEGELTRRIQQQPFAVVLFDEIEKAHPSVFDALLQVLGEGRLTNASGHTVDFCNTVVIMTSNLGVREANRHLGFGGPDQHQLDHHYRKAAEGFFRPEFFNRIDRVIPFRSLGRSAIAPLVRRLLQSLLGRRGLKHSNVLVKVDPELVELLIDQGFEPRYGARSMKRLLEQRLTVPLARHLVTTLLHHTTQVELYRFGDEIGMELQDLQHVEEERIEGLTVAKRWGDLQTQFSIMKRGLSQLSTDAGIQGLEEMRGDLLERFNQNALDTKEQETLIALGEVLSERRHLEEQIEHFAEAYMAQHTYEYMKVPGGVYLTNKAWQGEVPVSRSFQAEMPIAVERGRVFPQAREELHEMRIKLAALFHRAESLKEAEQSPVLLRFLPASEDESTGYWALQLAFHMALCWKPWASFRLYVRRLHHDDEGQVQQRWEALSDQTLLPEELGGGLLTSTEGAKFGFAGKRSWLGSSVMERPWQGSSSPFKDVRAAALALDGPGLLPLIEDELGLFLHGYAMGPDRQSDLVRVENVAADGDEPLVRLEALEGENEAFWKARREGQDHENPLPPLKIRRAFELGVCEDRKTGISLEIETLHKGLFLAAMMRLFAHFLEQEQS